MRHRALLALMAITSAVFAVVVPDLGLPRTAALIPLFGVAWAAWMLARE